MRTITDLSWASRGFSLLWGPAELARIAAPCEAVSVRRLVGLAHTWPEELPSNRGDTLVVAGVDACMDLLSADDISRWVEEELRTATMAFQRKYENQAGLVIWLPGGRRRIRVETADGAIRWQGDSNAGGGWIDLGRLLWGGAQVDHVRIMSPQERNQEPDGPAWNGLHLPRLS